MLAEAVTAALKARGWSLRVASVKTGLAQTTLVRMKSNEHVTRRASVIAFADGIGEPTAKWLALAGYHVPGEPPESRSDAPTSRSTGQGEVGSPPGVPAAVLEAIERAESREEKIAVAFNYLLRPELDLRLGADSMARTPTAAQLAIVRVWERTTGNVLLPPEVI